MAMLVRERLNLPADEREALFLLSWTGRAEEGLKAELGEDGPMTERAALLCLVGLLSRLRYICEDVFKTEKNALIVEENPFMAIDPGLATAEMKAEASEKLLLELERTGGGHVFEKYPLLRGLLDSRTENYIEVYRELFERLRRDRAEICRRFFAGEDFGLVTEIKGDSGDLHFHGRSTCIIVTERGRFVYKPHDCGIDVKFRELIGRGFSDMIRSPDCIEGEGYGWCEYVTPREVGSEAGAARFYRRFGGACALMQALGGSDLHSENWICSGEFPVLVDVETALSPAPRIYNDKSVFPELVTEEENFLYDANRSLIPSSLLPSRTGGREMSVLLDDSDYTSCEPMLSGKKLTVRGFEEEFLKGFSEGYDRCIEQSGELLRGLESFSGVTVRKLMRNTDSYAKLLKKLYSAAALRSGERRAAAVERLGDFFRLHGAEHMLPIARWEGECLLEGDIPYFSSMGGGHALLGCGNVVVEDFFRLSAVENARERIGRLSEAEKRFEMGLLSQSVSRAMIPVEPTKEPEPELSDFEPMSRQTALAEAEELFREIEGLMLTGPSGKPSWLIVSERGMNLVSIKPTFLQGAAGMGTFFAAMHAAGGGTAQRAEELADICLEQLEVTAEQLGEARYIPEKALPLGISDGFAGAFRALDIMESCLGTGRAGDLTRRLLELLGKADIENAHCMDVYSGAAGLLLELCRAYEHTGSDAALVQMERIAELLIRGRTLEYKGMLLWDTMDKKRPISGAGHGLAGIAAALLGAWKLLGGARYREAALAALEFEHGIYSEKLGTWPDLRTSPVASQAMHGLCSGAPGMGLAMLFCRESGLDSPELEEDIVRARRCCLTSRPIYRDHLCCGNSAALDFLLSLPDCREHAGRLLAFMKSRKDRGGRYHCLPENYRQVPCPDLFFGTAGIGYELLRYAQPNKLHQILF